jgi:hypothetical protein
MAQVFAGFVAGYAVALLSTPLLALTLLQARAGNGLLSRLLPPGTSAVSLAVILHGLLFFFWTAVGLLLGLLLLGMDGADAALGSRNLAFTLFVAGLTLAILAPPFILAPRLRRFLLLTGLFTLAVFGWLMPYMARWSAD